MNDIVIAVSPVIELVHSQPTVSSLTIAEHFRKSHKNVLRDIETLDCSEAFNRLNFEPIEYLDARGRAQSAIRMTRNGFLFLVMGYTGAAAARIKEAYIQRFDELEARTRLPEAEVGYFKRCERELIRVQRQCLTIMTWSKKGPLDAALFIGSQARNTPAPLPHASSRAWISTNVTP